MKRFTRSIAVLGLCLGSASLYSQDASEEIVVVANRITQPVNGVMAATTVIDRDAIRQSLAQSLAELLSGVPGMQLAPSGGQGAQTSLFLRGSESDHTLVLVDGVQMSTSTGSAARLEYIALDQVERIEIVRGPRSSLYGSEAIGGVINIITHTAVDPGLAGEVALMAGTEASSNANLSLRGGSEADTVALNLSRHRTGGISFKSGGDPDDDGYENDSLALSLGHRFDERVQLAASYSRFNTRSDYDDGQVDGKSQQLALTLSARPGERWSTRLSGEYFRERNDDSAAYGDTRSRSENRQLSWQNQLQFNTQNSLAFGLEHQEQELRYASFGAVQTANARDNDGLYGMFLHRGGPLDLTLSLRNDDNERFGNHATGSVAVGRQLATDWEGWVSYGTAFKAPNLIDLYVDFPSFFFFANPDLEPETSQNVELGLSGRLGNARLQFNLFRNDIDDLISTDASFTSLDNIQKARIDGLEASLQMSLAGWQAEGALTVLDHRNRSTGKPLVRRPERTLSLNLTRQWGALDLGMNLLAQSSHADIDPVSFGGSTVGGYGVASLVAGYQCGAKTDLRLRIGNLFDRDYQVVDGFNTYGRTAQLSLRHRF